MGGCGERAFRSLRMEIDEGERDEGKDEKEGWRWSEVPSCWVCAGGSEGELVPLPDEGGCGRCAATCIAAKAMVSIFTARLASLAYCAICARGPHQGCADAYALEWMRCLSAVVRQYVALSASGIAIADRGDYAVREDLATGPALVPEAHALHPAARAHNYPRASESAMQLSLIDNAPRADLQGQRWAGAMFGVARTPPQHHRQHDIIHARTRH